ncbi:MAG: 50S ribosomal protein L3 [Armatimonadetes bacterium]|jgi:large subunit ribosomal protein L3|nr:50S ribosomal protein L3 [Armatimonadota bacterium]MDI9582731.1 50S ribosomal protein L3 [Acidobacteriota bacterium]
MAKTILGKKIGMTRIFEPNGVEVAVTVVQAGPCTVVQRKTSDVDGYEAMQLGFEERKRSRTNAPLTGHFQSRNVTPKKYVRECRLGDGEGYASGDQVRVDIFKTGDVVDIVGTSKGKGFAGGMKRHGFKGGPATHGSKVHRAPQSSGATDAARVFKGTRKPGQMGNVRVTAKGLKILEVDPEANLLVIKGSVPGSNGGLLIITGRE